MGPMIGSTIWRMSHGKAMKLIEAKDREFHRHITKNRVDPTAQSATNPVPDFYGKPMCDAREIRCSYLHRLKGEKIGSIHDYRQVRIPAAASFE